MLVLEIAWEIITDFAAELIEGPDKERVRICFFKRLLMQTGQIVPMKNSVSTSDHQHS